MNRDRRHRHFICADCGEMFKVPYGTEKMGTQMNCPKCGSKNIHRNHSNTRGWKRRHGACAKVGE